MSENVSSEQELSPKQHLFIAALLAGHTIQLSAKAAGVTEKTGHKWLKLPQFQQAYRAAQRSIFDQALTGLMLKVDAAIATLERNMSGEDTPASVQVRAAQIVLEQAIASHKMSALESRIEELEQLLKQGKITV